MVMRPLKKQNLSPIVYPKKLPNTKAWKLTSEYVRKVANGRCYTCGRIIPFNKLSAGHLIEKIGCASIYFDLRGLRAQCFYCNRRLHGNKTIYTLKLIEEIGEKEVRALYKLSRENKFWRKDELKEIETAREKDIKGLEDLSP